MKQIFIRLALAGLFATSAGADAASGDSVVVPAAGTVEMAFSPNGGAEALVIKVIGSANTEIRMLAYSFTSAPVVKALIAAKRRGVSVALVVDERHNLGQDSSGKAGAALSALAEAGVDVRTTSAFAIHHDKVLVADRKTVQGGSFNYSAAAQRSNSENVVVQWNSPAVAGVFLSHFQRNYALAVPFKPRSR